MDNQPEKLERRTLPQPPSTSTLPQLAQLYASPVSHKPLQRSSNPFNPFTTQGLPNHSLTKSSDDLLRDYGIDFTKLSTKAVDGSGLLTPQPNTLSMIGQNETDDDVFADLDPLSNRATRQQPVAPPRAKRQDWTTFE